MENIHIQESRLKVATKISQVSRTLSTLAYSRCPHLPVFNNRRLSVLCLSRIFMSRIFHPCNTVPQFPFPAVSPLHFGIFWCRCFLFRCFMSRICSVPNQQSTLRTAHVCAYHCVQLSYKIQHRTSDNLRTYHVDSHHCADVVCWRAGRKSISLSAS